VGAIGVTVDAVLRKRQVSAVIGWVGLAWLAPIVGSLLYVAFGINRIQRAAVALQREPMLGDTGEFRATQAGGEFLDELAAQHPSLPGLARLGFQTTGNPLLPGNTSAAAQRRGGLPRHAGRDQLGHRDDHAAQLHLRSRCGRASPSSTRCAPPAARGVQVRVLIDDVGARYSRPTMVTHLREAGIPVATFLPTRSAAPLSVRQPAQPPQAARGRWPRGLHRRHEHSRRPRAQPTIPASPVRCLHFRLEGPIVYELQRTFAVDWAFATREALDKEPWFPRLSRHGTVVARGMPDGPDADLENILELMLGALSAAQSHVRIISPYFLVDDVLLRALQVTAMRGVTVDIVVPERSNLPVMDWAMAPQFVPLLDKGCRVHTSPPPFDHTKAFTVDGQWSLIGSTNWDARSLMLNFEFNWSATIHAHAAARCPDRRAHRRRAPAQPRRAARRAHYRCAFATGWRGSGCRTSDADPSRLRGPSTRPTHRADVARDRFSGEP
jgi:cardiolipin synthase A/B